MYSAIFELAKQPENLGIDDEHFNNHTCHSQAYDFAIALSSEERETALYKNRANSFGYAFSDIQVETEQLDGKKYEKVRFLNVDLYLKRRLKKYESLIDCLSLTTFLQCDPEDDMRHLLRPGLPLIYDPALSDVQTLDYWIRKAEKEVNSNNTTWYYIGKVFKYHYN